MSFYFGAPEAAPFSIRNGNKDCCLCVHGFTSSPALYRKLAPKLAENGFDVVVPALPGHATCAEDLAKVRHFREWFSACNAIFQLLLGEYERVHIIGLSLGGTTATWFGENYPDEPKLKSLVLLAPGWELYDKRFMKMDLLAEPDKMIELPFRSPKGDDFDIALFGYHKMPHGAIYQLIGACDEIIHDLEAIRTPMQILYTTADVVADTQVILDNMHRVASLEDSCDYPESDHNLLLGKRREDVMERILSFIKSKAK